MARLRGNPDVAKLFEAVLEYERELTERLVGAEHASVVSQTQGAIKALREFREAFNSAPVTIAKIAHNR